MKKLIVFALALLLALPLMGASKWTTNAVTDRLSDGQLVRFSASLDSVDTLTSSVFSLARYDALTFSSNPVAYGRLLTSASGKPRVTTVIEGSYDNSHWFAVDTVGITADSLETYGKGTLDLNGVKCPWYRVVYYGTAGNRADTTVELVFYLFRQDP